jgi:hypothetical protein
MVQLGDIHMVEENFPISEKLKVIEGTTIYKTDTWWSAVLLIESFGRKQVAIYLWNKKGDDWKRRQKFVVSNKDSWKKMAEAVDKYLK